MSKNIKAMTHNFITQTHTPSRNKLLALTFLLLLCTSAHAQQALFDKWEGKEGVSTVYISKNLLRLMPQGHSNNFAKKAEKIDQIRILNTENAKAAAAISSYATTFYKKMRFEVAMKINEAGQRVTIYQRKLKGGRTEYALFIETSGEVSIINVEGTLSLEDLHDISPSGK